MNKTMNSIAFVALSLAASSALAANWTIDTAHARVGFQVKHMMVSDVYGSFGKFSGTLTTDDKDLTKSAVHVEVDTASINTANTDRDNHLRSPDFFMSDKFPKMTFKSTKVEKSGSGYAVTGDLTIRDVTKPVVLTVEGPAPEVKTPFGTTVSAIKATGKINRKDFGLVWNKAIEAGGVVVGEEVTLVLDAELVKQEAPKAAEPAKAPAKKK